MSRWMGKQAWLIDAHVLPTSKPAAQTMTPAGRAACCCTPPRSNVFGTLYARGGTIVPTRVYLKDGRAKLEIAVAKVRSYTTNAPLWQNVTLNGKSNASFTSESETIQMNNNFFALIITFAIALTWLRLNDFAAARVGSAAISPKIIHMGRVRSSCLCWMLYTDAPSARYLAALVPLAITAQFFLVGSGILRDEAAVKAMSRSGDRREYCAGHSITVLSLLYSPFSFGDNPPRAWLR